MTIKCYSINDEDFNYTEAGDAIDALAAVGRLEVGEVYYEADAELVDLADYMDADAIIESAQDRLYDEVGEAAEDAFSVPQEAADELDQFLKDWCNKHLSGQTLWRCVGESREVKVTAEDVAAMAKEGRGDG
jgi:hypothetical protein